jgi:hypothetical protein
MYLGGREALDGFAKNLFAYFNFHVGVYLFVYLWLGALFVQPWVVLTAKLFGFAPSASYIQLAICIVLSLLLWGLPYRVLRLPFFLGLIYPITMIANEVVAFQSLRLSLMGRLSWKGRSLPPPKWKWL